MNLDSEVRNIEFYFFPARPPENHNYKIYDTVGIKILNRLRLKSSYLKQSEFGNNFTDTVNLFVDVLFLFPWNWDNFPFFLRCRNNTIYRTTLMNELSNVGNTITSLKQNDCNLAWGPDNNIKVLWGQKWSNSNQWILTAYEP